jgi:hypothetical protein
VSACALPFAAKGQFTSSAVAFRLDTAPLDLARAAHVLSATGVARQLGYGALVAQVGNKGDGLDWGYGDIDFVRKRGAEYWQRALGADELLYIAPAFAYDKNLTKPDEWLTEMIGKYGAQAE